MSEWRPFEPCLENLRMFRCSGCKRVVPYDFGCGDDMPHHCDDCWDAACPEHAR